MLDTQTIDRITELLLQGGLSQRAIAKRLGVSRGTVHAVAAGKRHVYEKPAKAAVPNGDYVRCPECGGKTQLPCTFCRIRRKTGTGKPRKPENRRSSEIRIELVGKHRERYLEVKAWRERQQNPHYYELPEHWPYRWEKGAGRKKDAQEETCRSTARD